MNFWISEFFVYFCSSPLRRTLPSKKLGRNHFCMKWEQFFTESLVYETLERWLGNHGCTFHQVNINKYFLFLFVAGVRPESQTKTVPIGQTATLTMTLVSPTQISLLEWRFNGNIKPMWVGNSTIEIPNVSKADEGIYECYDIGHREQGRQGIMRLIVRGKNARGFLNLTLLADWRRWVDWKPNFSEMCAVYLIPFINVWCCVCYTCTPTHDKDLHHIFSYRSDRIHIFSLLNL